MSQFKINEVELEIDMGDADFQETYEKAFENMGKAEKDLVKTGKASDITRSYCQMYFNLFDDIFGKGTADKIWGGKCKISACEDVYIQFIMECKKQTEQIRQHSDTFIKKFTPNRAARRAKK